jgi:AcrR family transcriptional regulator
MVSQQHRGPRERMVLSAVALIRREGVTGTGVRDVVEHAQAPRGSVQHYFPYGKQQLVGEALQWAGDFAAERVRRYLRRDDATPSGLFASMAKQWCDEFTKAGYASGCPLVAAAADTAATSDRLRADICTALDRWHGAVSEALTSMGVREQRAATLATVMLSALEGAIVIARVQQDTSPLDAVVAELAPILDRESQD